MVLHTELVVHHSVINGHPSEVQANKNKYKHDNNSSILNDDKDYTHEPLKMQINADTTY